MTFETVGHRVETRRVPMIWFWSPKPQGGVNIGASASARLEREGVHDIEQAVAMARELNLKPNLIEFYFAIVVVAVTDEVEVEIGRENCPVFAQYYLNPRIVDEKELFDVLRPSLAGAYRRHLLKRGEGAYFILPAGCEFSAESASDLVTVQKNDPVIKLYL